jgi:GMP synthase (glutamine-hydrolysing)
VTDTNPSSRSELVLILDFGGQYTQLIARRVRECRVYCEIVPHDTPLPVIAARQPKAIILSGGPASVYEKDAPRCDPALFGSGVPVLGICYGTQLMAYEMGGKVKPGEHKEFGRTDMQVIDSGGLFSGIDTANLTAWMSHGDLVESPPSGFVVSARTDGTPVAAMEDRARKLFGVQFHPEVVHTPCGKELLRNFLYAQCGLHGLWTPASFVQTAIEEIRNEVGSEGVVCGVSGGVDSSAVAALVHKAIGDQLTCVFVNHGLLRKNEAESVRRAFEDEFRIKLIYVDATDRFLRKLAGVKDPERKRKIIGEEFVRVFEEHAANIPGVKYLAQGTLYPDVIESGSTKNAAVIKSHHNVGGLPEDMNLKVLEPVRYLFKDEVREVATELGLPEAMVWRHPFPGPGLAIRCIGEVTPDRLATLREADSIVIEEIKQAGLYREVWQALAVLAPVRSVGVMGDQRTYADTIIVRAVTSEDAMTADWAHLPYEVLGKISNRIINEVPGVNRVVYDISSKPPATVEWE